jgi:hypothetical protein
VRLKRTLARGFPGWLLGVLLSTAAIAQTESDSPAASPPESTSEDQTADRAREAFVLGTALAREGQWLDALAAFERSAELRSHPVTTYNLAYCERALGRYTRARQLFKRALGEHAERKGGNLTDELLAQARSYLAEIERRLARATVTVSPLGTALTVDGRGLEPSESSAGRAVYVAGASDSSGPGTTPSGAFELLLDPGRHIFVLARPGAPDTVVTEVFKPGETRRLELSAGGPRKAKHSSPASHSPPGPDYTWPILAYGVGAAGLTIGGIFGLATFDKESDLSEQCPEKNCPDEVSGDDIDAGERYALISNIGFGVGIAGVGLGTFLMLTMSDAELQKPPKAAGGSSVRVWVLPTSAGLRAAF